MKKLSICIISLLLCIPLLTGCARIHFTTGLTNKEIFKVSDETCTLAQAKLLIGIERFKYEKSFGENIWNQTIENMKFEDYIKMQVKEELTHLTCMSLLAKENNTKLTSKESDTVEDTAKKFYESLSEEQINSTQITLNDVEELVEMYALSNKYYNELTDRANIDISDVDAKVIKVQHIFIKTFDYNEENEKSSYSEKKIEEAKQKAEELLEKSKSGEDFTTLAKENSDDSTVEYTFCKSEMIEEFSEAAFALDDGEISDVVETSDGFYIIKCISSYMEDETLAKKSELIEKEKASVLKEVYDPFVNTLAYQFNQKIWDGIPLSTVENIESNLYDVFEESYYQQ